MARILIDLGGSVTLISSAVVSSAVVSASVASGALVCAGASVVSSALVVASSSPFQAESAKGKTRIKESIKEINLIFFIIILP